MTDENEVIRYWSVLGCVMLKDKSAAASEALIKATQDTSPHVQVVAAAHNLSDGPPKPLYEMVTDANSGRSRSSV